MFNSPISLYCTDLTCFLSTTTGLVIKISAYPKTSRSNHNHFCACCEQQYNLDSKAASPYCIPQLMLVGSTPELINQKLVLLRRKQDAHTRLSRTLNKFAGGYKLALARFAIASCQKTEYICTLKFCQLRKRKPHLCTSAELSYFPCSRALKKSAFFLHTPRRRIANWHKTGESTATRPLSSLIRVCMRRRRRRQRKYPVCVYGFCIFERRQICAKQRERDSRVS